MTSLFAPIRAQWNFLSNNNAFYNLWLGQSVSYFGDHLYTFSILWWTLTYSNSVVAASVILLIVTASNMFGAPAIGVIVDQYDRRRLLITVTVVYFCVASLTGILMLTELMNLPIVYLLTLVTSLLDTAYFTSLGSITPSLLHKDDLRQGNSLLESTNAVSGIFAPAIGGAIAAAAIGWLPIINAVTFLINFSFIRALPESEKRSGESTRRRGIWKDLGEGFDFLRKQRSLLLLVFILGFVNLPMAPMGILVPAVILQDLNLGATSAGLATSAFALGVLLCVQLLASFKGLISDLLLIFLGILVLGIGNLIVALAPSLVLLLPGSILAGASTIAIILGGRTILQKIIPNELLGRVFSWNRAIGMSLRPVGLLAFGALADFAHPQTAVLVAAISMILLTTLYFPLRAAQFSEE